MTPSERQWLIWWRLAGEPEEISAGRLLEVPESVFHLDEGKGAGTPVFGTIASPSGRVYVLESFGGELFVFGGYGLGFHEAGPRLGPSKRRWTLLLHTAKAMIRYDLRREEEARGRTD